MFYPKLKPYSEIVKTAAKLFDVDELNVEAELDMRLKRLKISKTMVVIYVNWADWNTLTYSQIAEATGLTTLVVKNSLQKLRRRFKHLFNFGTHPDACRRYEAVSTDMDIKIKRKW